MALKRAFVTALALSAPTLSPASPANALPPVKVEYVHPEKFTDVGDSDFSSDQVRADYLDQLSRYLIHRAAGRVPQGEALTVSITEVDMAGGFEPWRRRLGNVRIIRDIYPPRIDLHFTLTGATGAVIKAGARKLRDPTFLMTTVSYRDDPLRYEKTLIDNWLEREFPRPNT